MRRTVAAIPLEAAPGFRILIVCGNTWGKGITLAEALLNLPTTRGMARRDAKLFTVHESCIVQENGGFAWGPSPTGTEPRLEAHATLHRFREIADACSLINLHA